MNATVEASIAAEKRGEPMAQFGIRHLSVLAYANGFTLWHYKATQIAEVDAPGFWDAGSDMLASCDLILCTSADGFKIVHVASVLRSVSAS